MRNKEKSGFFKNQVFGAPKHGDTFYIWANTYPYGLLRGIYGRGETYRCGEALT
jgi:hypothetical protein